MVKISVVVNGKKYVRDDVEPRKLLVDFIRNDLGLTGTNIGCDTSNCGACTVLVNGKAIKSCSMLAVQVDGYEVLTIEGTSDNEEFNPLQQAFYNDHALQCGYCTPGMIMVSIDLLKNNPHPSEEEIRMGISGNICRCTGYHNIVKAIKEASEKNPLASIPLPAQKDE